MVNVIGKPLQGTPELVNIGVTTIVETTGAFPVFNAVNAGIEPIPFNGKPMVALLFVHE